MTLPAPLFILSTGRSGTTSIAAMLSAIPGVAVVHERRPKLLEEAVAYRRGTLGHSALVELLRSSRDPAPLGAALLAGESNQRLSFVLPALAEAFPEARYVLLQRDGREVVDSLHHRWWYHPREAWLRHPSLRTWASTRFEGPDFGIDASEWRRMSPFARCSWYWSIVPQTVRLEADRLNLRILELQLEDLGESRGELENFLGLPSRSISAPPRSNATKSARASWRSWSPAMRRDFERYAGAEMDRCYPGWRAEFQWTVADEMMGFGRRLVGVARSAKAHINAFTGRRGRATDDEGGNP